MCVCVCVSTLCVCVCDGVLAQYRDLVVRYGLEATLC